MYRLRHFDSTFMAALICLSVLAGALRVDEVLQLPWWVIVLPVVAYPLFYLSVFLLHVTWTALSIFLTAIARTVASCIHQIEGRDE